MTLNLEAQHIRSILVTGCSTGIGRAACHALRDGGFEVIASARSADQVEVLRAEGFKCVVLDSADPESVRSAFVEAQLLTSTGTIDGLFLNAGYGQSGALEDLPRTALEEQFACNVFGPHQLIALALPSMIERGVGRIMFNSSVLGLVAMPLRGAYCASKFALEGLADCLRLELRGTGVAVGLLEPGPVLTSFRANSLAAFERHVGNRESRFAPRYARLRTKLALSGPAVPFTVSADRCARPVVQFFSSRSPRRRYPVTVQTWTFPSFGVSCLLVSWTCLPPVPDLGT